jgi:hypothetical protein
LWIRENKLCITLKINYEISDFVFISLQNINSLIFHTFIVATFSCLEVSQLIMICALWKVFGGNLLNWIFYGCSKMGRESSVTSSWLWLDLRMVLLCLSGGPKTSEHDRHASLTWWNWLVSPHQILVCWKSCFLNTHILTLARLYHRTLRA